jgi:hypothetical protein
LFCLLSELGNIYFLILLLECACIVISRILYILGWFIQHAFSPIDALRRVLPLWLGFFCDEAECLPWEETAVLLGGAPVGFLMSVYLRWWYASAFGPEA